MLRSFVAFVLLTVAAGTSFAQSVVASDLLTVAGKVRTTNRDPYEPFRDAFFKHHDRSFQKAFSFDLSALQKLPQHEVHAHVQGWPRAVRGKGPLLRDVLKVAGASSGAKLTVMALDGYAVEFEPTDLAAHDWVLAIEADGEPLGIGGRGPTWLMYDTGGKTLEPDREAKWVWSAFLIIVE